MKFLKLCLTLSLPALLLSIGCSENPTSPDLAADKEAIKQAIEADSEMFDVAGFDDNGAQSPNYDVGLGKGADLIEPLLFGRLGRPRLEDVDVEFTSDTTAIATVTHSFDGKFLILARGGGEDGGFPTLVKKEMQNLVYRRVKLVKVDDTGLDRRDWKIVWVSMLEGGSPETTIKVESLTIDLPDMEDIVVEDPLAYFFNREEGIPTFAPGDTVKLFVKLTNTNVYEPKPGETVLLRYKMDHRILRARKKFNDAGEYPDEVAGDGIYSGYWVIGHRGGIFHAAVDIFDNGTLYDDTEPYNSALWSMPYRVER